MDTEVFRVALQHHSLHMPGEENATEAERAPKWDEFSFTVLTSYCRGARCQTRLIALPHSEILAMWKGRGLRFVLNFAWYNAAEWREEEMLQTSWFHPVTHAWCKWVFKCNYWCWKNTESALWKFLAVDLFLCCIRGKSASVVLFHILDL